MLHSVEGEAKCLELKHRYIVWAVSLKMVPRGAPVTLELGAQAAPVLGVPDLRAVGNQGGNDLKIERGKMK